MSDLLKLPKISPYVSKYSRMGAFDVQKILGRKLPSSSSLVPQLRIFVFQIVYSSKNEYIPRIVCLQGPQVPFSCHIRIVDAWFNLLSILLI